jgi:3-(3-hydroxy-phenyl)propionate hydroxylase
MLRPGEDAARFAQTENVWSMLKKWITPDDAELERAVVYTFHAVIAQRWRQGRLMLAGDAAHQTPPFLGQGMCAGIRDAGNLAWKLSAILQYGASDALLDTYQQERYPHVSEFISLAVELGRIIQAVDQEAAAQRDEMFANGPRHLQSLSPRLGPSALLLHDAGGGLISHQPTLDDGRRMDAAAGSDFLLLTREGAFSEAQCEGARAAFPQPLRWIEDGSEPTREWLAALDADAVLVRPDRYIAGVARGGDALLGLTSSVGAALGATEVSVAA